MQCAQTGRDVVNGLWPRDGWFAILMSKVVLIGNIIHHNEEEEVNVICAVLSVD